MTTDELQAKVAAQPYWYHKIELPGGVVTPGWAPIDPVRYCLPADLTGMRVLDIGAWDGYWTFEALKRGAVEVVAIDDFTDDCGNPGIQRNGWATFDLCREALGFTEATYRNVSCKNPAGQSASRLEMSVYDLPGHFGDNHFDCVFCFGTIYHLKHPLLALEAISRVCKGAIYFETASLDEYSPYRGGIGAGFNRNERVMEFYPTTEYGNNPSNWWVPTLECLGAMLHSVGFGGIECWPLTETPTDLSQCRGFASGTKDPSVCPALHPPEVETQAAPAALKVAAVMSVPRLGFQTNMTCATQALFALNIPLINVQGAFWGQCLERGLTQIIDAGYDVALTIDYDSVFTRADVEAILRLMVTHPEATAIAPVQSGRGNFKVLASMHTPSGQMRQDVPIAEWQGETVKVASAHFGLTALRLKDLLEVPHPWFHDQPNTDGQWGPGRVDADIYFWKQLERHRKTSLVACRVPIGHIEEVITWPGEDFDPVFQRPGVYADHGKPQNAWK